MSGTTTPEFVIIRNTGGLPQDMTGWVLLSTIGSQTFTFPAGYTLAPGATVQIETFTGAVDNPPSVLLWTVSAIWNNAGDKAELLRPDNSVAASACYGAGCP